MRKLVECVPNFSEGRDRAVIEAIADAVRGTEGCTLLDVDPDASTNRTVYTFVGEPEAVVAGALAAARVARERIDMRRHSGEHPRIGALDVCPFVPVRSATMEDCVGCAEAFGERARGGAGDARVSLRPRGPGRSPADPAADPRGRVRGDWPIV